MLLQCKRARLVKFTFGDVLQAAGPMRPCHKAHLITLVQTVASTLYLQQRAFNSATLDLMMPESGSLLAMVRGHKSQESTYMPSPSSHHHPRCGSGAAWYGIRAWASMRRQDRWITLANNATGPQKEIADDERGCPGGKPEGPARNDFTISLARNFSVERGAWILPRRPRIVDQGSNLDECTVQQLQLVSNSFCVCILELIHRELGLSFE